MLIEQKIKTEEKKQVFILLGQSNAVGHNLPMAEEDKTVEPLRNVFGLRREFNQSYDIKELVWSGYTSDGMNLGESQDHTYSIVNCLARKWQQEINQGIALPDLYIVQIAIGAQGVTKKYMWHPDKARILKPGKLFETDISLYSFTRHILSLIKKSFERQGMEYEILGLHWRGGEEELNEVSGTLEKELKAIYKEIFTGLWDSLEGSVPTILHNIVVEEYVKKQPTAAAKRNMDYINNVFRQLSEDYGNISLLDTRSSPFYNPLARGSGLFQDDCMHYTKEVNEWVAEQVIETYKKNNPCV